MSDHMNKHMMLLASIAIGNMKLLTSKLSQYSNSLPTMEVTQEKNPN